MPQKQYHISTITEEHGLNGHSFRIENGASPFEIRSREVQDIMTRMPSLIIRQGTTALLLILATLLTGAYLIRLPDVVSLPVGISAVRMGKAGACQATTSLPLALAAKIRAGHRAIIKLPLYPFQEFGVLEGSVESISAKLQDTAYTLQIILPGGLKTNTNKVIPHQVRVFGTAEIITSDKTILERLFERILKKNDAR